MSDSYVPDPGASPVPPYTTVFLSQRDLGLQVPINFATAPGVSLTSACFAQQLYENARLGDCLSNLLAVGFRRLEIDLFWDQSRSLWSFCPVSALTLILSSVPSSTARTASPSTSQSAQTSTAASATRLSARQSTAASASAINSSSTDAPTGVASSLGSILPSLVAHPEATNETLVKLGLYTCSSSINLSSLTSLLLDYLQKTDTTLAAHLSYVIINLHAAASSASPTMLAPSPTQLPTSTNLVGNLFYSSLSAYLYTPDNLRSDRANLNNSWYAVPEEYRPTSDYYSTSSDVNDIFSTDSGWPSESYMEFSLSKRLLLQWGTVDPQMADYNFTADNGFIFPSGYIQNARNDVTASRTGTVTHGCYLVNSTANFSSINSSWATVATISGFDYATASSTDIMSALNLTSNLTNCGISTILNSTLLNATADQNYAPYLNFSYSSTIWSWAPGEPKNSSTGTDDSLFNCATSNLVLSGRWTVSDCSQKYYAACRATSQPYNWTITSYQISYSYASQACSIPYVFAAPRTALENSFLTQAMRESQNDLGDHGVWVDFNSLDVKGCWVTGGESATCPYASGNDLLERQTILVPMIAAIIVLVVIALIVFVNVAGSRRIRRRTNRRVNNGVFYEGVPS